MKIHSKFFLIFLFNLFFLANPLNSQANSPPLSLRDQAHAVFLAAFDARILAGENGIIKSINVGQQNLFVAFLAAQDSAPKVTFSAASTNVECRLMAIRSRNLEEITLRFSDCISPPLPAPISRAEISLLAPEVFQRLRATRTLYEHIHTKLNGAVVRADRVQALSTANSPCLAASISGEGEKVFITQRCLDSRP